MLYYCLKGTENIENNNLKFAKTNKGKLMVSSVCAVRDSKKSRFIKDQKARGLPSSLVLKTPLNKIPI